MDFAYSPKVQQLQARLSAFMEQHIYPNEARFHAEIETNRAAGNQWLPTRVMEELKEQARAAGLWNLFLPESKLGAGLTNLEYAPLCEIMGRASWSPEAFNCSAPDTGNMEVLARYGTEEQQRQWLTPLLEGRIRSCFAMTEPAVASSDATNIESSIVRDGDEYVINGRKWWSSGAGDPRCQVFIFMGKTDAANANRHLQQSMIIVPRDTPGFSIVRHLPVFGFEIAQGRLGPGRIHHCMRLIGLAERALEQMCKRSLSRVAFGKPVAHQGVTIERIAEARIMIDQARFLVLNAAHMMDTVGNKVAAKEIAMIKVAAPNMACQVIDWAIQAQGGGGMADPYLAPAYSAARSLRLADGP